VAVNLALAAAAFTLALRRSPAGRSDTPAAGEETPAAAAGTAAPVPFALPLLFATGFVSMGMEVVWTRAFTPVLRTTIYSFAALLTVYLWATWVGSWLYRRALRKGAVIPAGAWVAWLAVSALIPLFVNDPRIPVPPPARIALLLAGIVPFSAILGYLTPQLIDFHAGGSPGRAGRAYAINTLGCILGPLCAGYLLLPFVGVRLALVALAAPLALAFVGLWTRLGLALRQRLPAAVALAVALAVACFGVTSYEDGTDRAQVVRRDHVATVISSGVGLDKRLLVNGIGMTFLTPHHEVHGARSPGLRPA
jgi:spermidine synthase